MKLRFQYDKKAVISALRVHFLSRRETKMLRGLLLVIFLLSLWAYWKDAIPYVLVVVIFLAIILVTLIFWFVLPNSIYKKARTFREPAITLQCNDDGIAIDTQGGERRLPWQSFNRVMETPYFFYLYMNNNSFFLIPADIFENDEEKKGFRDLLQRHFDKYLVKYVQ